MKRRRLIALLFFGALALSAGLTAAMHWHGAGLGTPRAQANSDLLKDIPVYSADDDPDGIVILVSDSGGIARADRALVADLVDRGMSVLPVDLERWRKALNAAGGTCLYLGSDIEALAKNAQRALGSRNYLHPVVAGRGEGGTLAFAAVADAPAATVAGGVAIGAPPALRTKLPVCDGAAPTAAPRGGFTYDPGAGMPAPFTVVEPGSGGENAPPSPRRATFLTAPSGQLAEAGANAIAEIARTDAEELPLIDLAPAGPPVALVVFFSGDGGWRDLDKTIGEWLQGQGVHVVGVDSLRYFWSEKDPATMAGDIEQIIAGSGATAGLPVALFGYSFGADTLPFAFAHLSQSVAGRVSLVGLLAPGRATGFEISVGGWLGFSTGESPVVPAIGALPAAKVLCVHGADEDDSACPDPALSAVTSLQLSGGHHFDGDYDALGARLLAAIRSGPAAALAAPPGS